MTWELLNEVLQVPPGPFRYRLPEGLAIVMK